ncbi:cysteine desulfurase [bacterium SCGC AG-212-C10]|nr:cysteine desulfurase [bacterium SCGC AG-212-C10]
MNTFDVDAIRADFPILREQINGHPLVYLDSAATTQKPRQVIEALVRYYETTNANIHRGIHTLAVRATEEYEGVRAKVARFIGAGEPESVVFTRNTTESINLVAHAWGGGNIHEGDEIVLSLMEHHSNIVPWQLLARRTGARLRFAPITPEGTLDLDGLRALVGAKTKLVAVTHVSNVLGAINPVAEIARIAHTAGALVLVDGAQSAPHQPVDVAALGCDFFAFSAHKMLGPTGVGVLWARPELLAAMDPFLGGGDMISVVRQDASTWADLPHKFEAGTPNIADVIAFGAAIDYLEALGMDAIRDHERAITAYALDALDRLPDITTFGPRELDVRGGVVSFTMESIHPHDVSAVLDAYGVAIRAGHHCAQLLMRELNVPATNRASFYIYTTKAEIDALVAALNEARRVYGNEQRRAV